MLPFIPTTSLGPESSVEYQDLLAPAVEPEISLDLSQLPKWTKPMIFAHPFFACKAFPSHARFDAQKGRMVFI